MPPIQIKLINTSNAKKALEFKRLLASANYTASRIDSIEFKGVDLKEIESTPEMVAGMKAVMASRHHQTSGVLIDDTSLDIEGVPDAGINIRWLLDHDPEKFNTYLGKAATFRCILAILIHGITY